MDRGLSGQLRIGVIPTALPIVSHLTAPFSARFPRVSITVLSLNSHDIERGVAEFELEAGITYLDNEPLDHVRVKPIYHEEYFFLTPIGGEYADLDAIPWRRAAEASLCLLTPDMQNRRIIDGVFRSVGATPKAAVETNSIFNLVSHTASGRWSAIVPRPLLQFFGIPPSRGRCRSSSPSRARRSAILRPSAIRPRPLARNLLDMPIPDDIVGAIDAGSARRRR